jgi:hypothetical protein
VGARACGFCAAHPAELGADCCRVCGLVFFRTLYLRNSSQDVFAAGEISLIGVVDILPGEVCANRITGDIMGVPSGGPFDFGSNYSCSHKVSSHSFACERMIAS